MPRGARAWLRAGDEGILAEIAALSCAVRRTHDMSHHEEIYATYARLAAGDADAVRRRERTTLLRAAPELNALRSRLSATSYLHQLFRDIPIPPPSAMHLQLAAKTHCDDAQTRRWIVPQGWPINELTPSKSAAREAFEEAGVRSVRVAIESPLRQMSGSDLLVP
jgi:hypothetical protein